MKDQNISRLEILCSDALVMPIKRMLLGMKGVHQINDQLVVNAKATKNGVAAKSDGSSLAMFWVWLREQNLTRVTRKEVNEYCRGLGKAETAGGYLIKQAQEQGWLVKNAKLSHGKTFVYDVKLPRKDK